MERPEKLVTKDESDTVHSVLKLANKQKSDQTKVTTTNAICGNLYF